MAQINNNHFQEMAATIKSYRSSFKRPYQHKGSANLGELIPFYIEEVYPGDTIKLKTYGVWRTGTLIAPLMDNMYIDIYYFYVPMRIIWNHTKQFFGENDTSAWTQKTEYNIPCETITLNDDSLKVLKSGRTLYNYLVGETCPQAVTTNENKDFEINTLPLRAYWDIYNNYFRNQNTIAPKLFSKDDVDENITYLENCATANKFKDYFTSALPAPQKGSSVLIPISGTAPLQATSTLTPLNQPLRFGNNSSTSGNYAQLSGTSGNITHSTTSNTTTNITKTNLQVDLSTAINATVEALRVSMMTQQYLEKCGLYGTRYETEFIASQFGVFNNYPKDVPTYITGKRIPIVIDQVIQSASENSTASTPLGTTAAYSKTAGSDDGCTFSATEHGYIMGIQVLRQENTYSNSVPKLFLRQDNLDFYLPVFAELGEQPIGMREYAGNCQAVWSGMEKTTFGYQEAWAELRYSISKTSGLINPNATNSLSYWTLGQSTGLNTINVAKVSKASKDELDRALAATSTATGCQYIFDLYIDNTWSRPLPLFSAPSNVLDELG